jgi:cysteine desulfurase
MTKSRAYLDHNATAPLLAEAREAMISALELIGNPSSVHAEGRKARNVIEEARRAVADLVNVKPDHVTLTSGATEAANLALTPDHRMGRGPLRMSKLYVSAVEHPAVLTGGRFAKDDVTILPINGQGSIVIAALEAALSAHKREAGLPLVAVQLANNESGVIQSLAEISAMVKTHGGILIVDAVQAPGRIPLDMSNGYVDFLILSAHKMGGPKGIGALVSNSTLLMPAPLLRGGGQEKGHRAGTEALPLIAGFGAAARVAKERLGKMEDLLAKRSAIEAIVLRHAPDAIIHGAGVKRLPNTSFFTIPGLKAETAQIAFDLAGVALSAGSACSSGKLGASHVLEAMGLRNLGGALRVSIGHETTDADLALFESALREVVSRRSARAA